LPIKAVVFDLDETLVHEKASVDAAFLATCALAQETHGIDPAALHETVITRAREIWYAAPMRPYCRAVGISSWEGLAGPFGGDDDYTKALAEWTPGYRVTAWQRALRDHGVEDPRLAAALAARFPIERHKRHAPYDDALAAVEALKGTHRLAVLTNGIASIQRAKMRGAQLPDCFDPVVYSGDLRIGKPDRRIFEHLLIKLDTPGNQALMVGDTLERDIRGARNAGLRTVWINRFGTSRDDAIVPDAELTSLEKLPDAIAEM
jgi:putative hydrolase of the HAD superfamily